jgi:hypothetical protein
MRSDPSWIPKAALARCREQLNAGYYEAKTKWLQEHEYQGCFMGDALGVDCIDRGCKQCNPHQECNCCGRKDHLKKDCPRAGLACGICGEIGHLKVKCNRWEGGTNRLDEGSTKWDSGECVDEGEVLDAILQIVQSNEGMQMGTVMVQLYKTMPSAKAIVLRGGARRAREFLEQDMRLRLEHRDSSVFCSTASTKKPCKFGRRCHFLPVCGFGHPDGRAIDEED